MIQEIEDLLQYWAERCRRGLRTGGGASPLALAIEFGGLVPRAAGGRGLCGVVDQVALEVDGVLAAIGQLGRLGADLERLARVRYLTEPMPTVEQQMNRLKIHSKRTYHDRVHRLHRLVQQELLQRRANR